MYSVRIASSSGPDPDHEDGGTASGEDRAGSSSYSAVLAGEAATTSSEATTSEAQQQQQQQAESLAFSVGNPRVEHITGLVHWYRTVPEKPEHADDDQSIRQERGLPVERSTRLCVLSLPEDQSVAEFCQFLGAHLPKVREMRFVRRESNAEVFHPSMILMGFEVQEHADTFFAEYNNKPFSSLEPDVKCRMVFVKDVEVLSGGELDPRPPPGQTELPTCPVCLERLDMHISGVITTVCNHRFHNECLQQWTDSSCPVCRYVQQTPNSSNCVTCGTRDNLWICLICGHVGCGRYVEAHAHDHFHESGHCYSLEMQTQRVWDYVSDGYVHRLIRSHVDGKIVEVPSPAPGGMLGSMDSDDCCGHGPEDPYLRELEEAQVNSKLDAIAQEYNHLLASQLDSQRSYFEGMVASVSRDAEERAAAALAEAAGMREKASAAARDAKEAASATRSLQRRLQESEQKESKLKEEKEFLRNLNDTLIANQKEWQKKVAALEAEGGSKDTQIQDLQEQLHDMMMYIEAQQTIAAASGGEELAGGTLLPVPAEEGGKGKGRARRHRS